MCLDVALFGFNIFEDLRASYLFLSVDLGRFLPLFV